MQNLRGKIILSLVLALVVFLALAFYSDLPRLLGALAEFQWQYFPLALAAAFLNYLLRFVRWHYYLGVIGIHSVPRRDSFFIFFAGMCLTMTPGKMGEVVKSFLLKDHYATPLTTSAPIVAVERLTDVLGVFALASLGLVFFPVGLGAVAIFLIAVTLFIVVINDAPSPNGFSIQPLGCPSWVASPILRGTCTRAHICSSGQSR
jgi:glycosyltransferase 2 family protein